MIELATVESDKLVIKLFLLPLTKILQKWEKHRKQQLIIGSVELINKFPRVIAIVLYHGTENRKGGLEGCTGIIAALAEKRGHKIS